MLDFALIILAAVGGFALGRMEAWGAVTREWGRISAEWGDLRAEWGRLRDAKHRLP